MTVVTKITRDMKTADTGALGLCLGASIRTPCGPRRIENIRKGDLIVTRDNGLQPVRMVWTRKISAKELAADMSLAPVHLKPRAIGPMMPQQSLSVGSAHRVLVPGWRLEDVAETTSFLIPAREIAEQNDESFVDRAITDVTYYNIIFDTHQVFAANGLPVESFLPCAETMNCLDKEISEGITELFPQLRKFPASYPSVRYSTPETPRYRAQGA